MSTRRKGTLTVKKESVREKEKGRGKKKEGKRKGEKEKSTWWG